MFLELGLVFKLLIRVFHLNTSFGFRTESKMKIALVFLAVLGLTLAASINVQKPATRTLEDDWIEFVTLIPRGRVINILVNHLASDEEFQAVILYLITDEFEDIVVELDGEPDFLNVLDYLEAQGLGVYDFLNTIHDFLNIPLIPVPTSSSPAGVAVNVPSLIAGLGSVDLQKIISVLAAANFPKTASKGYCDVFHEIAAIWPSEEVRAFHQDKLVSSPEYIALFNALSADEFRVLLNKMIVLPSWQRIVADFVIVGVDVDNLTQWFRDLFGWTL